MNPIGLCELVQGELSGVASFVGGDPLGAGPTSDATAGDPPRVERGVKSQTGVSLDWLRFSGPAELLMDVWGWLLGRFGEGEVAKRGQFFYQRRVVFPGGASLLFDPPELEDGAKHFTVDFPGSLLASVGEESIVWASEFLSMGLHATRCDVAVDWRGERVGLIRQVVCSCEAGELTGARRFRHVVETSSRGGKLGETVYLGRRGKDGSGRYVRVYDKGLESGEELAGVWERWETEFTGERTDVVVRQIVGFGGVGFAGWERRAMGLAFGAVDFRVRNGRREIARRKRCEWWAEFLGGLSVKRVAPAEKRDVAFDKWLRWVRRAVVPTMVAMMRKGGVGVADYWRQISAGVDVRREVCARVAVWQYVQRLSQSFPHGVGVEGLS